MFQWHYTTFRAEQIFEDVYHCRNVNSESWSCVFQWQPSCLHAFMPSCLSLQVPWQIYNEWLAGLCIRKAWCSIELTASSFNLHMHTHVYTHTHKKKKRECGERLPVLSLNGVISHHFQFLFIEAVEIGWLKQLTSRSDWKGAKCSPVVLHTKEL